jgi:hypothetical protein
MAARPWVTPQEVRDWSERQSVKNRSDDKLAIDITRAEQWVINYTRNNFSDPDRYPVIPEPVRIAVLILAEQFAANSANLGAAGGGGTFKSERFDDYSYTLADTEFQIDNLDLGSLLDEFADRSGPGNIVMKMRKL